jgi:hypothetical protein
MKKPAPIVSDWGGLLAGADYEGESKARLVLGEREISLV